MGPMNLRRSKIILMVWTGRFAALSTESQESLAENGVSVARRGWATEGDILNTFPYNELKAWFKS